MSTARLIDLNYVKTGQVRIVAKNYPVHGAPAEKAAEAALCAMDQGKFWDYHDKLLEELYRGNRVALAADGLKQVADSVGLDATAFSSCVDSGKYTQRVNDEAVEAEKLGVNATPTFFVNETMVVGAQPFGAFTTAIESALARP